MSKLTLAFTTKGWEEHSYWQTTDKKTLRKVNKLLAEVLRTPFSGTGKPEPLKENYSGYWSRRITDEHRLIYAVTDSQIIILSCRFHYNKK